MTKSEKIKSLKIGDRLFYVDQTTKELVTLIMSEPNENTHTYVDEQKEIINSYPLTEKSRHHLLVNQRLFFTDKERAANYLEKIIAEDLAARSEINTIENADLGGLMGMLMDAWISQQKEKPHKEDIIKAMIDTFEKQTEAYYGTQIIH